MYATARLPLTPNSGATKVPSSSYPLHAFRWLIVVGLLALASIARAEDLDFHLDLNTGGHSARVTDLAFTPDGQELVSSSDDKTIRIWDWQSGVTLRTIRGYLGNGNAHLDRP